MFVDHLAGSAWKERVRSQQKNNEKRWEKKEIPIRNQASSLALVRRAVEGGDSAASFLAAGEDGGDCVGVSAGIALFLLGPNV